MVVTEKYNDLCGFIPQGLRIPQPDFALNVITAVVDRDLHQWSAIKFNTFADGTV